MWLLQAVSGETDQQPGAARAACFYVPAGTFPLGRKGNKFSLVLLDDESISRSHAQLTVPGGDNAQPELTGALKLQGIMHESGASAKTHVCCCKCLGRTVTIAKPVELCTASTSESMLSKKETEGDWLMTSALQIPRAMGQP